MTLRTAFLITAVALGQTLLSAQTKPSQLTEAQIQAGLFTIRPDGQRGSSAVQTGNHLGADMSGTVYMAPCSTVGASDPGRAVSASATEVWQLSGKVLAISPDEASVEIGWQRIRRGGQNETSSPQSITLTLRRGERTTLEAIEVPAAGSCQARAGSLDVVFASVEEMLGTESVAFNGKKARVDGTATVSTGSQGELKSTVVARAGQSAPTTLQADLWLVRSAPGRVDETLHITSPVIAIPRQFAFNPVTIQTSTGALYVRVEGTVEVGTSPEGDRRFYFSANRTVNFAPTNRPPRDGARAVEGSTKTTVSMPKPDEVLSFEMPPLRIPGGETLPDRLSIRVRLTSVPMRK